MPSAARSKKLPAEADRLRLERLAIPAGSGLDARTAPGPEVLVVETGEVVITDDFGFSSPLPADSGILLNAGTQYQLANDSLDDATLLRLSVVGDGGGGAEAAASPAASPVDSQSGFVLDQETELPTGAVTLFIASVTLEPGAESGEQEHAGPLGIVVEEGTLTVTSPSGLEGQLRAGGAAALPTDAPLQARNAGDEPTIALIVGVVDASGALLSAPVLDPTATAVPTETPQPTATTEPTPTPAPTEPPTPTPVPTTEPGTILQVGQTWRVADAALTMAVQDGTQFGGCGVNLNFIYENLTGNRVDFEIPPGVLRVYDDQQEIWESSDQSSVDRVILDPSESIEYKWGACVPPNDGGYTANVYVAVENFGAIDTAKWGFTWDRGRILTLPPDAEDPTSSAPSDSASAETDSGASDNIQSVGSSGGASNLSVFLPTEDDVPEELVTTVDNERSLDEVAENYTDPAGTTDLFTEWGWQGNAIRAFNVPDGVDPIPDKVQGIYVSIHQFGDAGGAISALDFSLDEQSADSPLEEIDAEPLGEYSRALYGRLDYGNEHTIFVQQVSLLIRVSASSLEADPTDGAVDIMEVILAKVAGGETVTLVGLLPTEAEVPAGLVFIEEFNLTADEITASFADPADASQRFVDWGWQENAYRAFAADSGSLPPESAFYLEVGIHRFDTADGAAQALPYFADDRAAQLSMSETVFEPMGDTSRALTGAVPDGSETTLYVQVGDLLIRLTAWSVSGDPTSDMVSVMETILSKA